MNGFQEYIRAVMLRDLRGLRRELEAYDDEAAIWSLPPGVINSAGTLTLHITGNLQAFVGAALGGSGYVRDRRAEFEQRNVPRSDLLLRVEQTASAVQVTLTNLATSRLEQPFPLSLGHLHVTTGEFLIHLATHLAFHLGQIDYHRRLVSGDDKSIGPVPIDELASAEHA